DPAFTGPEFLQIGTESGFLPKPVTLKHQPITYITDPTAFWVGNVDKMGLALGPAERADVIIDFKDFAGKTLILYNDAPAAWPAGVGLYDYYTGAPDNRDTGGFGAGGTYNKVTGVFENGHGPEVGYAPNTRTVMQIIVRPTTGSDPAYTFSQANLEKEFTYLAPVTAVNPAPAKTLFERAQEPIIVGQAAYNEAYPSSYFPPNFPWEGIAQINDQSLQFVTLAGEPVIIATEPKALHDEMGASFDPIYGRMSGNLGMQIPNPTTLTATMVNYGFTDVPSEYVTNSTTTNITVVPDPVTGYNKRTDGTEIWKISHNGVDTHPIHFHIFDVQVINRVGWDGQILMPEPNELGWKEVVKISPLEDTIVAVRPRAPALPFGITNSLRPLNPAIPTGSTMGFTSIDPVTGQAYVAPSPFAAGVTNILLNFGWEYVWHCHILSHEEMDMMRPIVLTVINNKPDAPTETTAAVFTKDVNVTWVDPTPLASATTLGNIKNEIGFRIERCAGHTCTDFSKIGTALANATSFTDTAAIVGVDAYLRYRIFAYNAAGDSPASNIITAMDTSPINGVCGASNGTTFIAEPTVGFCTTGAASALTGTGPWAWSCAGFNTGTTANCAAQRQQYTLHFVAGANGTISGSSTQSVNHNANATAVIAVPNTAYSFVSWTNSAGTIVTLLPTITATAVKANETYTANFTMHKDFNSDGTADILWTNSTNNSSIVWYMNNVTKLTEAALPAPPTGNGWAIVGTGDFNHDGKTDLLWRNSSTGANMIYYMNGVTKLSQVTVASQATPWVVGGVADFDKDGNVDILWRHPTATTNNLFIWYMNGAAKKGASSAYIVRDRIAMGQPWIVAGVGDFNADGNPDILWRHPTATTNNTYVWHMNGATVASASTYLANMAQPWIVAGVTDFNKDGKPDILWRNPNTNTNNTQVWYMNGILQAGTAVNVTPDLASNWQIVGK
ncbi:MAG: FG-GAP-like repeat-containing protein, partial [Desulfuromonadales bacterium]